VAAGGEVSAVRLLDEHQVEWTYKAGSVCSALVNPLKNKFGFRIIILPRATILTGEWTAPAATDLPLEHQVRMQDCRDALSPAGGGE
jgi:hypothetical protein